MNDRDRAAGRAGAGAVMGSKNLKGIAVRGRKEVKLYNPEEFSAVNTKYRDQFKEATKDNPSLLRLHGTAITVVGTQSHGVFPTRNFQQGTFEGWESIYGETLTKKYLVRPKPCFSCPIACGRVTRIADGPYKGEGEGPEYETIYALGSDCGVDDLAALTKANYICNELGLDTISMGSAIACAMELFEKGYLAGYDPRGEQGMGLAYATSPIGASHMRGDPAYFELLGVPTNLDPLTWEDKPPIVAKWQDVFSIIDSAGLCVFFTIRYLVEQTLAASPTGIMELLNAATGAGYTIDELEKAGERIFNAERLFLKRSGFSSQHDSLPPRITVEPLPDGPAKGMICHLDQMLDQYYKLREWTDEGFPGEGKLKDLGLL